MLDLPALAASMFLELPGLGGHLPLRVCVCGSGSGLPGLHVCGCPQTPSAGPPHTHAGQGLGCLPEGEGQSQAYLLTCVYECHWE